MSRGLSSSVRELMVDSKLSRYCNDTSFSSCNCEDVAMEAWLVNTVVAEPEGGHTYGCRSSQICTYGRGSQV